MSPVEPGSTRAPKRVAVFCGSSAGRDPAFGVMAEQVGTLLARRGLELVYGGGRVGLMGILADAALGSGGTVIGVIPRSMVEREVAHHGTDLRIVGTMHERKALIYHLADAVIALPGGFGTLDELFEVLTWNQLRLHALPAGLVDVAGYFDGLIAYLDRAVDDGLLKPAHRAFLLHHADPEILIDLLLSATLDAGDKWS